MKIIDAYWEKKNINVNTVEVIIDVNDTLESIKSRIENLKADYLVLKLPVAKIDLQLFIQSQGFQYVETIFNLRCKTVNIKNPIIYKRFEKDLNYKAEDNALREEVLKEIKSGRIFNTDRIALDPYFSIELAGNRYYNWAVQELERGASLNVAYYKEMAVAFGIGKIVDTTCDNLLGGVLEYGQDRGLGFAAICANHNYAKIAGAKKVQASVSSNNPAMLRLHMMFGYEIKNMYYVFVKHN